MKEKQSQMLHSPPLQELLLLLWAFIWLVGYIWTHIYAFRLEVKERWGRNKTKTFLNLISESLWHCLDEISAHKLLVEISSQTNAFCWERSKKVEREINFNYFRAPLLQDNTAHSFHFQQIAYPHLCGYFSFNINGLGCEGRLQHKF